MYVHANAKLGLAGRLCAGASDRGGDVVGGEGGGVQCLAGDRAPRVASLVGRWPRADGAAGSLESATPLAPAARPRAAGADLRLPSQDGLGSAPGRRRDRLGAFDCLEGAQARRALASPVDGQGAGQQLRVALPGRPAAHGRLPLRAPRSG